MHAAAAFCTRSPTSPCLLPSTPHRSSTACWHVLASVTHMHSPSIHVAPLALHPHPQKFKGSWLNQFNAAGANQNNSMENYFSSCSYGKTVFVSTAYVL